MSVRFQGYSKEISVNNEKKLSNWLVSVFQSYDTSRKLKLDVILCNDDELLEINKTYLNHDFYTDIITFPIETTEKELEAELYVSVDRIRDNALQHGVDYQHEFSRVLVHGVLHLCGFNDKSTSEQREMRALEDKHLKEIS